MNELRMACGAGLGPQQIHSDFPALAARSSRVQ